MSESDETIALAAPKKSTIISGHELSIDDLVTMTPPDFKHRGISPSESSGRVVLRRRRRAGDLVRASASPLLTALREVGGVVSAFASARHRRNHRVWQAKSSASPISRALQSNFIWSGFLGVGHSFDEIRALSGPLGAKNRGLTATESMPTSRLVYSRGRACALDGAVRLLLQAR